jgi:hypothetical protein
MGIDVIEFSKLEKKLPKIRQSPLNYLAPQIGKIYVITISRDSCPACAKQKSQLSNLAKTITKKHRDKVLFTRIHVKYANGSTEESTRSKDVFGHYFYPTNLILLRTIDRGAIEYYRNASSNMEELEKNIEIALEIATFIEKETT